MATAFGFSAGDFISAIHLINKVRKAVQQSGGAASQYQGLVIELENLSATLSHLEALQPNEDNAQYVNAIRAMAMACKWPLQEFLQQLYKFESSLGPFAKSQSLRKAGQSVRWGVSFVDEVEKMRALVAAKHISINLLLAMETSRAVGNTKTAVHQGFQNLGEKAAEHRVALQSVQERMQGMEDATRQAQNSARRHHENTSRDIEDMNHSLSRVRHLGEQVMSYLNAFPRRIQGLLCAILQSNLQSYNLLLQMQRDIAQRPTNLLESNIRFEDALGEIRHLPYEYFRHWEPFEGFLKAHFKNKPGEPKILASQYYILDPKDEGSVIKKEDWSRRVGPGATLSMALIMAFLTVVHRKCPRCSHEAAEIQPENEAQDNTRSLTCQSCGLSYFYNPDNEYSSSAENGDLDETEVEERQASEDMKLYGDRPKPIDVNVDVAVTTSQTSLVQSQAQTGAVQPDLYERADNIFTVDKSEQFDRLSVPAMDWNSGTSRLDSWLNQSAVPESSRLNVSQDNDPEQANVSQISEERDLLPVVRSIHVKAPKIVTGQAVGKAMTTKSWESSPRAQIYSRNITDRYPDLPKFLVARLTRASCKRAEHLSSLRKALKTRLGCQPSREKTQAKKVRKKTTARPRIRGTRGMPDQHGKKSASGLARALRAVRALQPSYDEDLPKKHKHPDFWSGAFNTTLPAESLPSSENTFLYGSRADSSSDIEPTFTMGNSSGASSKSFGSSAPHFLHPPVDLKDRKTFSCDVCGKTVCNMDKSGWQAHILEDLRPYVCTFEDCPLTNATFDSKKEYEFHEISEHYIKMVQDGIKERAAAWEEMARNPPRPKGRFRRVRDMLNFMASAEPDVSSSKPHNFRPSTDPIGFKIDCVFCGEELLFGCPALGSHVGRHMEEIAFTIVSRPHGVWDFYSESSSNSSKAASPLTSQNKGPKPRESLLKQNLVTPPKDIKNRKTEIARKWKVDPIVDVSTKTVEVGGNKIKTVKKGTQQGASVKGHDYMYAAQKPEDTSTYEWIDEVEDTYRRIKPAHAKARKRSNKSHRKDRSHDSNPYPGIVAGSVMKPVEPVKADEWTWSTF